MSTLPDTDGTAPFTNRIQVSAGACLILATHSTDKLAELRRILTPLVPGLAPESIILAASLQTPESAKDDLSFADNTLLRARIPARTAGLLTVTDDSGLYVDVLGGAPGVFSARWSGRHGSDTANLQLLLDQLGDVTDPYRGARFICATVLVQSASGGQAEQVTAIERPMEGRLVHIPQGKRGFGYDPIFVPVQEDEPGGRGHTTAQMTPEEKYAVSHWGQALRALVSVLAEILAG